jgi:hypothetical protein
VSVCRASIRVRVPDRPGALGLVASRIGAVKGDIVGIEVLDRTDGAALDELAVILPEADLIPTLEREIAEVDGASVVAVEVVDAFPEPRLDEVHFALALSRARDTSELGAALSARVDELVRPVWVAVAGPGFAIRTDDADAASLEIATEVVELAVADITLEIARAAPLTPGERALVGAYCELVDALVVRLPAGAWPIAEG